MSAVTLLKPSSLQSTNVFGATGIGRDATFDFSIKTFNYNASWYSPTEETTGDGDTGPCYQNSGFQYGTLVVNGAMVTTQAESVENMMDSTRNPTARMRVYQGSGTYVEHKWIIERFEVAWRLTAATVGVRIHARKTDDNADQVTP